MAQGQYRSDPRGCDEVVARCMVYEDITGAEYRDWLDEEETEIFDKRKESENERSDDA